METIPRELYGYIASRDPKSKQEILSKMSRLNKTLSRRTKTDLQKLCEEDIALSEVNRYLKTHPDQFALITRGVHHTLRTSVTSDAFTVYTTSRGDQEMNYRIQGNNYNSEVIYTDQQVYRVDYGPGGLSDENTRGFIIATTVAVELQEGIKGQIEGDIWSYIRLDLPSTYRIFQRRKSCLTIPNYAKEGCHRILDAYYHDYLKTKDEITPTALLKLFCMHKYTQINAYLLGIIDALSIDVSLSYLFKKDDLIDDASDDINRLKPLKKEIETYVPLIHEAIDQLE